MIYLITGASHTGKTLLAQKLLEKFGYPYLSLDLLEMGLIRSGQTELTVTDSDLLTDYLWSIVKEMIKTALENQQHLIVEGSYIPFDWQKDFSSAYLKNIHYICLIMSDEYIKKSFQNIKKHACAIEKRVDGSYFTLDFALAENQKYLRLCQEHGCPYLLLEKDYQPDLIFEKVKRRQDERENSENI
ncbi:AAA family ATPase [Streptococcus massiliensis]|uniref:Adenylate kinase n=1 Tax=Streptococcus massiliensis TaxID=313439 RepID=A0A380KV19_9STRE|nr:AAA family ATPase [Streptococcus massiliensis]SUN75763.1 adenylate kinase [Streptococcus massiliensis]